MPFVKGQVSNPIGKLPGTKNRATIARERFLAEQAERLHNALGGPNATAHSTLVEIYRSPHSTPQLKFQAASVAIKYEMPSLQATHHSGGVEVNVSFAERLINARSRIGAAPTIDLQGSASDKLSFADDTVFAEPAPDMSNLSS